MAYVQRNISAGDGETTTEPDTWDIEGSSDGEDETPTEPDDQAYVIDNIEYYQALNTTVETLVNCPEDDVQNLLYKLQGCRCPTDFVQSMLGTGYANSIRCRSNWRVIHLDNKTLGSLIDPIYYHHISLATTYVQMMRACNSLRKFQPADLLLASLTAEPSTKARTAPNSLDLQIIIEIIINCGEQFVLGFLPRLRTCFSLYDLIESISLHPKSDKWRTIDTTETVLQVLIDEIRTCPLECMTSFAMQIRTCSSLEELARSTSILTETYQVIIGAIVICSEGFLVELLRKLHNCDSLQDLASSLVPVVSQVAMHRVYLLPPKVRTLTLRICNCSEKDLTALTEEIRTDSSLTELLFAAGTSRHTLGNKTHFQPPLDGAVPASPKTSQHTGGRVVPTPPGGGGGEENPVLGFRVHT